MMRCLSYISLLLAGFASCVVVNLELELAGHVLAFAGKRVQIRTSTCQRQAAHKKAATLTQKPAYARTKKQTAQTSREHLCRLMSEKDPSRILAVSVPYQGPSLYELSITSAHPQGPNPKTTSILGFALCGMAVARAKGSLFGTLGPERCALQAPLSTISSEDSSAVQAAKHRICPNHSYVYGVHFFFQRCGESFFFKVWL